MPSPGSFEWLRDEITKEIQEERPGLDFWIEETFPDYVLIRTFPDGDYYKVEFQPNAAGEEAGEISLGEWTEMQQQWTPLEKEMRMLVPVQKAGPGAQRITLGVVLEPEEYDLQGDIMKAEDIELSAHAWMEHSQTAGLAHAEIVKGARPVESYLAPCDFAVKCADGTEETVKKGSWVLGMRWPEKVWKQIIAGDISGYSVGGRGVRVPIAEDGDDGET